MSSSEFIPITSSTFILVTAFSFTHTHRPPDPLHVSNTHLHTDAPQAVDRARKTEDEQQRVIRVVTAGQCIRARVEFVGDVAEAVEAEGRKATGREVDEHVVVLLEPTEEHLPRVLPSLHLRFTGLEKEARE